MNLGAINPYIYIYIEYRKAISHKCAASALTIMIKVSSALEDEQP